MNPPECQALYEERAPCAFVVTAKPAMDTALLLM